jgi:hypothetical protein
MTTIKSPASPLDVSSAPKATDKAERYYGRSYGNECKFLFGIKKHERSGLYYATTANVAQMKFVRIRQKAYLDEQDNGQWMRLGTPGRFGCIRMLSFPKLKEITARITDFVFRPFYKGMPERQPDGTYTGDAQSFSVVDLARVRYTEDRRTGTSTPGPKTEIAGPYDIPAAKCLILIRASDIVEHGSRSQSLPSIADLDPKLAVITEGLKISQAVGSVDEQEEDEEW